MTPISRDDFEALIRRAGLRLPAAEIEQLHEGWALVEPMLERIRTAGRERAAEPAHMFRAEASLPRPGKTETP